MTSQEKSSLCAVPVAARIAKAYWCFDCAGACRVISHRVPLSARLFSFTPLPLQELAIVAGLAVIYVCVLDVIKVWFYRKIEKEDIPPGRTHPLSGELHNEGCV